MKRKNDIESLLDDNQKTFQEIKELIEGSLEEKEIAPGLRIKIKNFLENARSALDYLAHDIAEQYELSGSKIYFPIVGKNKNSDSYRGAVGRNLPGLESANRGLFSHIESIQPYNEKFAWLGDFIDIVTNTKHQMLVPVIKEETQRIVSEHSSGSRVSWDPAAVRFGSGVSIQGALVNPITQMPEPTADTKIKREIWVNFRFSNGCSVIPLLDHISEDTPRIIEEIYNILSV